MGLFLEMFSASNSRTWKLFAMALIVVGLVCTAAYRGSQARGDETVKPAAEGSDKAPAATGVRKTPALPTAGEVAKEAAEKFSTGVGLSKLAIVVALFVVPMIVGNWLAGILRMPDHGWKFALAIGSLAAAAIMVSLGEVKLGPDLSGGITLIYELAGGQKEAAVQDKAAEKSSEQGDKKEKSAEEDSGSRASFSGLDGEDKIAALIKALTERVDPSGTKEVTIRKYGEGQIEIIIPNAEKQDLEYIERKIYTAGALEFRITANEQFAKHRSYIDLARRLPPGENVVRLDGQPVARWVPYEEKEFGSPEAAARRGLVTRLSGEVPQALVMVDDALNVTGEYLRSASPDVDETGNPQVSFVFNERGASLFGQLTRNHLPNPSGEHYNLGILLDGRLLTAPTIESEIRDRGRISGGSMTQEEVDFVVGILNAGSLPAALNKDPISRAQISPTIGKETVRKGKIALAVSLGVVALFMLVYYRAAGIIAVFGLAANMLLILGVMVLIKGAFTLPGLAGLVLTVGMSVDANVLINERIREELKRGAALRMAIRNGYSRAWVTIVDSNVTNLITALVIYKIAPDNVKGFGVTLIIGILMSIFAAVFLTRVVFDVAERKGWIKSLPMRQFIGETNIDFLSWRWACIGGSLAVILIGLLAALSRKSDLLDIDFTGGTSVQFVLDDEHKMKYAEVQAALEKSELGQQNLSLVEMGETDSRYTVTTINDNVAEVEAALRNAFGEKLKTYRLEVKDVREIAGLQRRPAALLGAVPALPLWASPVMQASLLQAAEPAEATAEAASDAAATDGEKPQEEADADDGEEAESPAADSASAEPAEESAELAAVDPFSGGTSAKIVYTVVDEVDSAGGVNFSTIDLQTKAALEACGYDSVAYEITHDSPDFDPTSIRAFADWDVKLALPPDDARKVFNALETKTNGQPIFPLSNKIGGRVAGRMTSEAIAATILSLAGVMAYVWFRFHRLIYGVAAVAALIHDVLVAIGFVALSSYFVKGAQPLAEALLVDKFQIGLVLVAAFLTIIGYSLNDTIVVFDRIREVKGKSPRLTGKMINDSVNQTLARTLLTSFTTFMTIVVLYLFAGEGIHGFAYAMLIGVIAGSYSTIFIANPILLWLAEHFDGAAPDSRGAKAA
jgi:SecD/SecF fusion protein